jgi:hypothetical protein
MTEQSHREEMSAAIRAQRERQAVPRSLAPPDDPPARSHDAPVEPSPPPPRPRKSLLARLRGK